MNIKAWNIILVVALLSVTGVGGWIFYQNNQQKQAEQQASEEAARLEAQKQRAEHMQQVEDFLNGFLTNVNTEAMEYKKRRMILTNLVKPENMTSPQYVSENVSLAQSTVLALQLQMEKVMKLFSNEDGKFVSLLSFLDEVDRPPLQSKWDLERKKQADLFMAYFASEQDLLKAYESLLGFYNEKKDVFHVNVEDKKLIFDSPEDQAAEEKLQSEIKILLDAQEKMLAGDAAPAP